MKTIEVVAAVIRDGGRILATERGYGDFKGGWEFPGGKMEPGETPEAAVVREIEEELRVTVRPTAFIETVEYDYPTFHLTMHCFMCEVVSGEITLTEHLAMKWLTKETLETVDWLPADVSVVRKLEEMI
ncbi:MAG: 8-oxo-dGTP diphosphatase MutT [Sutterella parvirubra]|nr:8-oxo-dGTP diphosphatase MutT [Sutterella parvirubra]